MTASIEVAVLTYANASDFGRGDSGEGIPVPAAGGHRRRAFVATSSAGASRGGRWPGARDVGLVLVERVGAPVSLRLVPPLGYLDFLALEAGARLVLTDSGGVQEETTVLGVPCLTLRDTTERPLTVTEGTNTVVGRDPRRILAETRRVLRDGVVPRRPALWDGCAAQRIADVLFS